MSEGMGSRQQVLADALQHFRRQPGGIVAAGELERQHHVLQRVQCRQQLKRLEYETQESRAQRGAAVLVQVGQIGAGITTAPMECFNDALAALAKRLQRLPEGKRGAS